ncbi:MAG: hypothetical protein AAGD25_31690 [Cyanobacteria bacterium P01_F01_bin.150]
MTRSTVVLSLITLLALGGCNAPVDESSSSTTGQSSEQLADQSTSGASTEASTDTAPPSTVSQLQDSPSADKASSLSETTDANAGKVKDNPQANNTTSANSPSAPSAADKPLDPASEGENSAGSSSANASANASANSGVTVQSAQAEIRDTAVVPGEKVGVVTAGTTYEQLEKEFGSDRLTTEEIHLGEGIMAASTKVTLDDDYSFNVVWSDASQSQPLEVRDLGTAWNLQGIHNGMSFDALKSSLGEFELLGFGWDYGGTLLLENTSLAPYVGQLFIRVQPSQKAVETQHEKFLAVAGDSAFASSNANFSDLELSVVEIVVRLN